MTGPSSNPRTWAATRQNAADRTARQDVLRSLTARAGRLTPTETALLQELVTGMQDELDAFRRRNAALNRHTGALGKRLEAAEATIREVEQDLGWTRQQLLAAQQETTDAVTRAEKAEAALERVRAAAHIADDHDITDWQRGYRAATNRILAALDDTA